jgi:hypothetical protein
MEAVVAVLSCVWSQNADIPLTAMSVKIRISLERESLGSTFGSILQYGHVNIGKESIYFIRNKAFFHILLRLLITSISKQILQLHHRQYSPNSLHDTSHHCLHPAYTKPHHTTQPTPHQWHTTHHTVYTTHTLNSIVCTSAAVLSDSSPLPINRIGHPS